MGDQLTQTAGYLSETGGLSPQQRKDRRSRIAIRAKAILGQFWRDDATPDVEQALELEGWADVLEHCTEDEIRRAWARYQIDGPRTKAGKLYKPDAGALYRVIVSARPVVKVVEEPEPPRKRVDPERALEIIEEVDPFRESNVVQSWRRVFE